MRRGTKYTCGRCCGKDVIWTIKTAKCGTHRCSGVQDQKYECRLVRVHILYNMFQIFYLWFSLCCCLHGGPQILCMIYVFFFKIFIITNRNGYCVSGCQRMNVGVKLYIKEKNNYITKKIKKIKITCKIKFSQVYKLVNIEIPKNKKRRFIIFCKRLLKTLECWVLWMREVGEQS